MQTNPNLAEVEVNLWNREHPDEPIKLSSVRASLDRKIEKETGIKQQTITVARSKNPRYNK
jgi:hypothetical protein